MLTAIFGHTHIYITRQIVWAMYDLINNKTISALQFLYHGHLDLQTKKNKNTNEGEKKHGHSPFQIMSSQQDFAAIAWTKCQHFLTSILFFF